MTQRTIISTRNSTTRKVTGRSRVRSTTLSEMPSDRINDDPERLHLEVIMEAILFLAWRHFYSGRISYFPRVSNPHLIIASDA